MELKLSNAVVTIKDKLKFGDICKIKVASGIINDDGVQKKDVKNDQIQDPKMVKEMMGMICKNPYPKFCIRLRSIPMAMEF